MASVPSPAFVHQRGTICETLLEGGGVVRVNGDTITRNDHEMFSLKDSNIAMGWIWGNGTTSGQSVCGCGCASTETS
jgi:hypothetical protein